MDIYRRRSFLQGVELLEGKIKREKVCAIEVWCECYEKNKADMKKSDSIEINNILNSLKGWRKNPKAKRFKEYGLQRFFERI